MAIKRIQHLMEIDGKWYWLDASDNVLSGPFKTKLEAIQEGNLPRESNPLDTDYKDAFVWVYGVHPYCVGFPGITGDLFFSSHEAFLKCRGRLDDYEALVKVRVPKDFDDWDYIPDSY